MNRLGFLILFLAATIVSEAQVTVGPKVGFSLSRQKETSPYQVLKQGVHYGGVARIEILDFLSIQGEILVSQKGYREEFDGDQAFDELTSTYLEIPAMVSLSKATNDFTIIANAGVYNAFWQAGEFQSTIDGPDAIITESYQFVSSPDASGYKDNRVDFGVLGGLGILYDRFGSGNFILEFRYAKGLSKINSFEVEPSDYNPRKNETFSVSLSYMLFL